MTRTSRVSGAKPALTTVIRYVPTRQGFDTIYAKVGVRHRHGRLLIPLDQNLRIGDGGAGGVEHANFNGAKSLGCGRGRDRGERHEQGNAGDHETGAKQTTDGDST